MFVFVVVVVTVTCCNGILYQGTIIAPQAAVQFNNAVIDGSFFVKSLQGNGELLDNRYVSDWLCHAQR